MTDADNPRANMGDNTANAPDYAGQEVARLQRDYAELANTVGALEAQRDSIPEVIPDDDVKGAVADLVKRTRDAVRRTDALREVEGQPHFRRKQGVDQFFFGLIDRLSKRERRNRDGVADDLLARLTEYDTRKLAEEQERRRREFEEAERIRKAAEADRVRKEQEAEAARLAAERARKPDTAAAKGEIAGAKDLDAAVARVEETVATSAAQQAYVDTLARAPDLMRQRTAGGTLSTMRTEAYAEIVTVAELDGAKLWAFVPFAEKEKALRAWAKSVDYGEQMAGASIGRRPKSTVR